MRRAATAADLTLFAAGLILVAAVATVAAILSPPPADGLEDGSSYAPHARGTKAAYLVLRDLGYDVQRSFEPFATLRADASATVVLLIDPAQQPSDGDLSALHAFVEDGGLLLAAGPAAAGFLPDARVDYARSGDGPIHKSSYRPAFPSPLMRDTTAVRMSPAGRSVVADPSIWVPIFGTAQEPAVLMARRGAGRIIWFTSAEPLSNAGIAEPGHLELLLNALAVPASRQILWDEHYHGHSRSLWSYARGTPVAWGLVQLTIVGAAALFTAGRRVGPARCRAADPRTSPLELIETVGSLYERARTAAAAVDVARMRARRLLQTRSGLPPAASDDRVADAAERLGLNPETVRAILADSAAAAGDPRLDEDAAVALVGRLQRMAADASSGGSPGGISSSRKAAVPVAPGRDDGAAP